MDARQTPTYLLNTPQPKMSGKRRASMPDLRLGTFGYQAALQFVARQK